MPDLKYLMYYFLIYISLLHTWAKYLQKFFNSSRTFQQFFFFFFERGWLKYTNKVFCLLSKEALQASMLKMREKLKPDKSIQTRHRLFCPHFFRCLFISLQGLEWLLFPILSSCCVVSGGPRPTRSSTCHCKSVCFLLLMGKSIYTHNCVLKHVGASNQNSETRLLGRCCEDCTQNKATILEKHGSTVLSYM